MLIKDTLLKLPFGRSLHNHLYSYPTPVALTYFWSFGFLAGVILVIQIITGLVLSMHYIAHTGSAFTAIDHIMREVNSGWVFRLIHANGASAFFFIVYVHIAKAMWAQSYDDDRDSLWYSGVTLFILLMATAFTGYILPWGQMSFWGATVITSLITTIPVFGEPLAYLVWGGYNIGDATLTRFFTLHFILPFVIGAIVLTHLILLHGFGSKMPLLTPTNDTANFYPYFFWKDGLTIFLVIGVLTIFLTFTPNYLGHPDNFILANSLVTPAHIVPEWYFLPFYAILRAIPSKIGGVVFMVMAILALYSCTQHWIDDSRFSRIFTVTYVLFILNFILLGYLGGQVAEGGYLWLSRFCTIYYFFYLDILLPMMHRMSDENLSFYELFTQYTYEPYDLSSRPRCENKPWREWFWDIVFFLIAAGVVYVIFKGRTHH